MEDKYIILVNILNESSEFTYIRNKFKDFVREKNFELSTNLIIHTKYDGLLDLYDLLKEFGIPIGASHTLPRFLSTLDQKKEHILNEIVRIEKFYKFKVITIISANINGNPLISEINGYELSEQLKNGHVDLQLYKKINS